jgi:hypothetical protein
MAFSASSSDTAKSTKTWQPGSFNQEHKRWIGVYSKGASGKLKLLRYDIVKLVKSGGILSAASLGTVFTLDSTIRKVLVAHLVLATLSAGLVFLDPGLSTNEVKGLILLSKYLNGFVPFVLGLYIALALTRWWLLRTTALAPVYDCLCSICVLAAVLLPSTEELRPVRESILKYGIACVTLVMQAARENDDVSALVKQDLLTGQEAKLIERFGLYQRAMIMWSWIPRIMFFAFEAHDIPWPVYTNVMRESLKAREAIQTIHTYLWTQIPFAYVHLINLIVNIQNIVNSVKCGMVAGITFRELFFRDGPFTLYYTILSEIVTWFTIPVIYHGLLTISYIVQDPFGEDVLDFPISAYSDNVVDTCRALLAARDCPSEVALFGHVARLAHLRDAQDSDVYRTESEVQVTQCSSVSAEGTSYQSGSTFTQSRVVQPETPTALDEEEQVDLEGLVCATLGEAAEFLSKLEAQLPALDAYMAYSGLSGLTMASKSNAEATKKQIAYSSLHPVLAKMAVLANEFEANSKDSAVRLQEVVKDM